MLTMLKFLLENLILSAVCVSTISAAGNPATYWSDYSPCENSCHQSVWETQLCSLANSCSCAGCLCLSDSCLCGTSSWQIAVVQCIAEKCGSASVSDAVGVAHSACAANNYVLAVPTASLISIGLAALPQTQTSAEAQATTLVSVSTKVESASAVGNSVGSTTAAATAVMTTSASTVTAQGFGSKSAASVGTSVNGGSSSKVTDSPISSDTAVQGINTPVAGSSSGLSTGAKAGIGVGAALGVIVILFLVGLIIYQRRQNNKLKAATKPLSLETELKGPQELNGAGLDVSGIKAGKNSQIMESHQRAATLSPVSPTVEGVAQKDTFAVEVEALSPQEKMELEGRRRAAELSGEGRDIPVAPAGSERIELEARRRVFELP